MNDLMILLKIIENNFGNNENTALYLQSKMTVP